MNKARFFDNDVKNRAEVSVAKIIKVLVSFTMKMDTMLGEMRKLLSGSLVAGLSQAPLPPPKEQPQAQELFEVLRDRLQQHRIKEIIQEVAKIEVPVPEVRPAEVPITIPSSAKEKKKVDSETKVASSEPSSPKKSNRKKKRSRHRNLRKKKNWLQE